jgi:RNA polymerase sigma-70 factor (ECF subfamily)
MLVQGGSGETEEARAEWEHLARSYWQPLYVFLRRQGLDHHAAADDIQGFFIHLLSRDFLRRIERGNGLFRSFLLAALKNWRTDQHRAATAKKRGDGVAPLPLDELEAAGAVVPEERDSPEAAMDRRWARAVYDNTLATLHQQLKGRGREPQFLKLVGVFTGENVAKDEEIAVDLGMSVGAVKQSASELRREFGTVLRREIRRTVAEEAQVDGEIRYLLGLLRG